MTRVVEIPSQFDEKTFDSFARSLSLTDGERLLFDAHATKWASPYCLVALLAAGQYAAEHGLERPLLTVPNERDVARYWARTGFFEHAGALFDLHGRVPKISASGASDVLLEVTPIRGDDDVHEVVGRIQERAARILSHELGLEAQATVGFAMALSEACQNIVEHAEASGWVAVQTYSWRKRLGRRVVLIAVADAGVGFRQSLEASQARNYGDRWGDAPALEAAVIQGISRFRDPGRGQGLAGVRRYISRWSGKLSIRSGTARIGLIPSWDDDVPLAEGLPYFPGSQMQMIIPAQEQK